MCIRDRRGACELLRNLDNYQRIVEGAYGYGQQRLQETLGLGLMALGAAIAVGWRCV